MKKVLKIILRVGIVLVLGFLLVTLYYMFIHESLVEKRNAERTYTPTYDIAYKLSNDYEPLQHLKKEVSSKDTYSPENTEISYVFEIRPIKKFTSIQIITTEGEVLEEVFFNDKKETSDGYEQIYLRLTPDISLTSNRNFEVIPYKLKEKKYKTEDFRKNLPNTTEDKNKKANTGSTSGRGTNNHQSNKKNDSEGVIIEEVEESNEIEDVIIP